MKSNFWLKASLFFILATLLASCLINTTPLLKKATFQNINQMFMPPSFSHWFGTDFLGRDVLYRLISGALPSLLLSALSTLLSLSLGLALGVIAGYKEGLASQIIMGACNLILSLPYLVVAILCVLLLGNSVVGILLGMSLSYTPVFIRLVYSQLLATKKEDFIFMAQAQGASFYYLLRYHFLPILKPQLTVQGITGISGAILSLGVLSFLGFGLPSSVINWGTMLVDAQNNLQESFYPAFFTLSFVTLSVWALHFLAEGLRKKYD